MQRSVLVSYNRRSNVDFILRGGRELAEWFGFWCRTLGFGFGFGSASAPESLERPPVYWSVGASSIVPFDELGAWTTIDGVIAAQINPAARLGLRFSRASMTSIR